MAENKAAEGGEVETPEEEIEVATEKTPTTTAALGDRKVSWARLRRVDSLNLEAGRVSTTHSQCYSSQVRCRKESTCMREINNLLCKWKPEVSVYERMVNRSVIISACIYIHTYWPQVNWGRTLSLALQSVGVVYGDIGTSPLYVFSSTFGGHINNNEDILGVLSLIIYTIALIPLLKYVFVVLHANDNGDGNSRLMR